MTIILSKRDLIEPKRPIVGGKPSTHAFKNITHQMIMDATNVWYQGEDNTMYNLKSRNGETGTIIRADMVSTVTLARLTEGHPA